MVDNSVSRENISTNLPALGRVNISNNPPALEQGEYHCVNQGELLQADIKQEIHDCETMRNAP